MYGTLMISNQASINRPANAGGVNSYDVEFKNPNFFVNNHFLTPVQTCYGVELSTPVTLEAGDKLRIKIKVPKQILGERYGYDLEGIDAHAMTASLRLKSTDGIVDLGSPDVSVSVTSLCGWYVISIERVVGDDGLCNLCEITYGLCFEQFQLKTLYDVGEGNDTETVKFNSDTHLEIENGSA